jgi:hypothetical protein
MIWWIADQWYDYDWTGLCWYEWLLTNDMIMIGKGNNDMIGQGCNDIIDWRLCWYDWLLTNGMIMIWKGNNDMIGQGCNDIIDQGCTDMINCWLTMIWKCTNECWLMIWIWYWMTSQGLINDIGGSNDMEWYEMISKGPGEGAIDMEWYPSG